jgi:YaiO family outer membrane protein
LFQKFHKLTIKSFSFFLGKLIVYIMLSSTIVLVFQPLTFASSRLSKNSFTKQPGILKKIIIHKTRNSLEVKILCDKYFSHRKIELSNPDRIVVDFFDTEENQARRYIEVGDFGIRAIRTSMSKPNIARAVFDLEEKIPCHKIERSQAGLRVYFWREDGDGKGREEEKKVQNEKTQREDRKEKDQGEEKKQEKIDLDDLFKKARTIAFQGNHSEARDICKNILEKEPGYHEVRVFLGRLHAWDQEYDSARKELQKVLREKPNYIDALIALIDVEYWNGNLDLALIYCNQDLRAYPNHEDFLLRKAKILVSMKDFKEATENIKKLLKINPSHKEALQLLNDIKFSSQLYAASVRYIYDKFKRDESDFGPWHLLSLELSRKSELGSIIGRVNCTSRDFGSGSKSGTQFEVDAYPKITKRMYAYLNAGYSSSSVFPKYRFGSQLFRALPAGFEVSLGFRYLNYPGSSVIIYTGHLGKYIKNYLFSFQPFVASKSSGISFSGLFLIKRYFADEDNYLTFLFGFGSTPLKIFFLEDIERLNSYKVGLEIKRRISRSLLIGFHIRFEKEEFQIDRFGNRYAFEISLQQRF